MRNMTLITKRSLTESEDPNIIEYTEGKRQKKSAKLETILSKAEVRLFCYFFLNNKNFVIPLAIQEELRNFLNYGHLKEPFGYMTKQGNVLVIKKEKDGYYGVYFGLNEDSSFYYGIRKLISKVKN